MLFSGAMGKNLGYLGKWLTFLLKRRNQGGEKINNSYIVVIMLQYDQKHPGRNKFIYDHTDSKWFDVDCYYLW